MHRLLEKIRCDTNNTHKSRHVTELVLGNKKSLSLQKQLAKNYQIQNSMNGQRSKGNSKFQLIERRIFCTWLQEFHSLLVAKKQTNKQKWHLAGTYMRHMGRKVFI
jgi:hypothetical protein